MKNSEKFAQVEHTTESRRITATDPNGETHEVGGLHWVRVQGEGSYENATGDKVPYTYGIPGDCDIFQMDASFTTAELVKRIKNMVSYIIETDDVTELEAVTTVTDDLNKSSNITQRQTFRPTPTGGTGQREVNKVAKTALEAGFTPAEIKAVIEGLRAKKAKEADTGTEG